MKTSKEYQHIVAELKGDVELSIAKILMKHKDIKSVAYKGTMFDIRIGENENGARCVFLCELPLMTYKLEDTLEVLEDLEYCVENIT